MSTLARDGRPEIVLKEDAVVELPLQTPASSKFRIAFSANSIPPNIHPPMALIDSQDESSVPMSDETSGQESMSEEPVVTPVRHPRSKTLLPPSPPPRLSRAFSMPLSSQLGHLQNPRRFNTASPTSPLGEPPTFMTQFHELSLELADSVQMAIQTILQVSPPHVLDPAKEQFAACAIAIPTPSISALLTFMKNLNYMAANMPFLGQPRDSLVCTPPPHAPKNAFDVGEMLQSIGDVLSGITAQAGVHLVLYHDDVDMRHVSVRGDECGVSYALTHVSFTKFSCTIGVYLP